MYAWKLTQVHNYSMYVCINVFINLSWNLEFRDSEDNANMTVNSAIDDSECENSAIDNYEYYHNIGFIQYDNYKKGHEFIK